MKFFNELSLKNKIFVSCLGFIILVSMVIALFTRALLISGLTSELKKRGIGIAQSVAESSRVFILTRNKAELTALAYDAKIGNRKSIVKYLIISDNEGNILAHTFTTLFPDNIKQIAQKHSDEQKGIKLINMEKQSVFHVWVPVKEGLYTVGLVQIGLNKQHINDLIASLRLVFLSFLSVVTIIFFFISNRLAHHITKPVSSLIRYTDQLTKGDFNIIPENDIGHLARTPGYKDDEISKLTNSFINMTSKLKTSTN